MVQRYAKEGHNELLNAHHVIDIVLPHKAAQAMDKPAGKGDSSKADAKVGHGDCAPHNGVALVHPVRGSRHPVQQCTQCRPPLLPPAGENNQTILTRKRDIVTYDILTRADFWPLFGGRPRFVGVVPRRDDPANAGGGIRRSLCIDAVGESSSDDSSSLPRRSMPFRSLGFSAAGCCTWEAAAAARIVFAPDFCIAVRTSLSLTL